MVWIPDRQGDRDKHLRQMLHVSARLHYDGEWQTAKFLGHCLVHDQCCCAIGKQGVDSDSAQTNAWCWQEKNCRTGIDFGSADMIDGLHILVFLQWRS